MTTTDSTDIAAALHRTGDPNFLSTLRDGHQRFLAHAIEHSFVSGRRTAQDFIRHFPARAIMKGLEYQPSLRSAILVLTTGLKQKIALKKEWNDAATDLEIALDEGETDAEAIVALFHSDDRVRFLDPQKLWVFLTEGEFWKSSSANKMQADAARNHIAFMLERALEDKLITHKDIVEGVTVEELSNRLPKTELGRLIQCALQNAEKGGAFTEADLLATTPPRSLVQYVPLPHIWDTVIAPRIAQRHGYSGEPKPVSSVMNPMVEPSSKAAAPAHVAQEIAPSIAKEQTNPKPAATAAVAKPKDGSLKDVSPLKDKVKLKPPAAEPPPKSEAAPGVQKSAAASFFGDEDDDIEVLEDDAKTG
jgi:hypothetical protein